MDPRRLQTLLGGAFAAGAVVGAICTYALSNREDGTLQGKGEEHAAEVKAAHEAALAIARQRATKNTDNVPAPADQADTLVTEQALRALLRRALHDPHGDKEHWSEGSKASDDQR